MKKRRDPKKPPKTDWRAFDAVGEERDQAVLSDLDSPPPTEPQLAHARRAAAARTLAQLGGSELALKAPPRRRQKAK
jgi:hypothetical protein